MFGGLAQKLSYSAPQLSALRWVLSFHPAWIDAVELLAQTWAKASRLS